MPMLDIQNQPSLGLARTVGLTVTGIRYRLFRSLVSVVVITVAVAFFMNLLGASLIRHNIGTSVGQRVRELRTAAAWATRLSHPGTVESLLRTLAALSPASPQADEIAHFGQLSPDALPILFANAREAAGWLNYFRTLDYGRRRQLLQAAQGVKIFDSLRQPQEWNRFNKQRGALSLPPMPGSDNQLRAFLDRWTDLRSQLDQILAARQQAIRSLASHLRGRSALEAMAQGDEALFARIRQLGFAFDENTAQLVATQARQLRLAEQFEQTAAQPAMRRVLAARRDTRPDAITPRAMWEELGTPAGAAWYLGELRKKGLATPSEDPAQATRIAERKLEEYALRQVERLEGDDTGGWLGLGERVQWLLIISMLVCIVGITNAMLMSVTERFREIATLKCLGALDGSIMGMFVLEACTLGAVGGLIGAVLGAFIGFLRAAVSFGPYAVSALPLGELFLGMGAAFLLGILLAGGAAILPAYQAARLAPMEAMRIE